MYRAAEKPGVGEVKEYSWIGREREPNASAYQFDPDIGGGHISKLSGESPVRRPANSRSWAVLKPIPMMNGGWWW
jgi:hypothetical protein